MVGVLMLIAVIAGSLGTPLTAGAASAPQWRACPGNVPAPLECTTIRVPLDYRKPNGARLEVAMSRLKATNPATRRGVLLLNPGGPSVPGLDLAIRQLAPQSLTDSYDLIGFDPRGVGRSSPVTCKLTPEQLDPAKLFPQPAPDGDISASVAYARQAARQCAQHEGAVLPYITTANTARDMDQIRIALGEPKISYFGASYGSYLGAVYTTLFPHRSDRIVLDSVFDPRAIWRDAWRHWGPATEERFADFANWAAERDPTYQLGATPQTIRNTYFALAAKLDAQPLPTMTGNEFRGYVRYALYSDDNFDDMATLWQSLRRGDAAPARVAHPFTAALWAVVCGDTSWPSSITLHQRQVLADRRNYPITNGLPSNIWPCAFWPSKPVEPPVPITDRGPSNILLTQNLRDPATPLAGAVAMRSALGNRARLVTVDQGGHGAYLQTGNTCVTGAATTFLVTGTLPATDVFCGKETAASEPLGQWNELVGNLHARQFPF